MKLPHVKALVFDVFGTVVDWRGSIIRECRALGEKRRIERDWVAFADAWRAGYRPAMQRVRAGDLPWTHIDVLHRMILDDLVRQFDLQKLSEADKTHLNLVWHRLKPWRDSVRGLKRLKQRFIIGTLSNGNVSLLANMAKHSKLPWDVIFSAELFKHYKPDPETYLGAAELLGLKPSALMLVAAHKDDLLAAKACGLATGFIPRPREHGPGVAVDLSHDKRFTLNADSFIELAEQFEL
jgi:2-haloacid dehalogenase